MSNVKISKKMVDRFAERGSELRQKMERGKAPSCYLCKEIKAKVLYSMCGGEVRYYCKTEEIQIECPDCQIPCDEYGKRTTENIPELK